MRIILARDTMGSGDKELWHGKYSSRRHRKLARFLVQHTNELRDVPWCGALNLLQKPLHNRFFLAYRPSRYRSILKVKEYSSQLNSLIEHGLGVPWLVYIRPRASNNPPERHS